MKQGDLIQVRQPIVRERTHEQKHTAQYEQVDEWIYARVLSPPGAGAAAAPALVQVEHPGNMMHGLQDNVPAADCRTKADILALLAAEKNTELRRHYKAQADRLT